MRLDTNPSYWTEIPSMQSNIRSTGARSTVLNWYQRNRETFIDTKFSRFLGRQPVMVPGMTLCTFRWDSVAATMNAGYQIELVCELPHFLGILYILC